MKLSPRLFDAFREAIALVDASSFGLTGIEIYPGATRYSPRSAVVCRFQSSHDALLKQVAKESGRLVSARLGIEVCWGAQQDFEGGTACWVEYFPGGANYASGLFSMRALQAALVAAGAERSGDAVHREVAKRELALLEKVPAPEVFLQSRFIIAAARSADIPVNNVAGTSVGWQFGWGSRSDIFHKTASTADSVPGHQITWKKNIAKALFRELGLPTPEWRLVSSYDDALRAAEHVGWPCAVKPIDRAFGTGVTANVRTPAELDAAVIAAQKYARKILIEAHEPGADHRLMVVDGRLIAAVRREPPSVTGDGKSSIGDLIAALNRDRDGTRARGYLVPVERDLALEATLAGQGLSVDSVLAGGVVLALRSIANFSTGGIAKDVTGEVHPQIKGMAELLATSVGLRAAGIDYITPDISRSHSEAGGGFIEVNAMPRLRVLMVADHPDGKIGSLMLGSRPGRIPVTLIVGSDEALAELAEPARARTASVPGAAAVSAQWAQIGATDLPAAGLDAFAAVAAALRHLAVNELTILWSAARIRQFGLPVDKLDRAILIDGAFDEPWLFDYCSDIVRVEAAPAALEAAFGQSVRPAATTA